MGRYHEGELEVQRRAGVLLNAERIGRSIHREISPVARRFVEDRSFVIVGAADVDGRVWATVLHGPPGFLAVPHEHVLVVDAALPASDPLAAALATEGDVGLLIIDPATRRRMRVNGRARPRGAHGFEVTTREVYANCPKHIRPRDVHLAEAVAGRDETVVARSATLTRAQAGLLRVADTIFLASRHPVAGADVSHRGGAPGFVRVPAPGRVLLPDYPGNMMFNTLGNLTADPRAGLLLVDFDGGGTLQITGRASVVWDPTAVAPFDGADRVVEIEVDEVVETRRVSRAIAPA
jgi:uncharacterized protein